LPGPALSGVTLLAGRDVSMAVTGAPGLLVVPSQLGDHVNVHIRAADRSAAFPGRLVAMYIPAAATNVA